MSFEYDAGILINMVKPSISWYSLRQKGEIYLTDAVSVPKEIHLEGDEIRWNPQNPDFATKDVDESEKLLFSFANLVLVGPEAILDFARNWGVLGLCGHGLPATHKASLVSPSGVAANFTCQPTGKESIEQWQEYARRVRALINVAAQVNKEDVVDSEDWLVLGVREESQPKEISSSQALIEDIANGLLDLADVRPRIGLNPAKIKISYPADSSLFGLLAIRVAQNVARTTAPLICSSCGELHNLESPDRRPRAGERSYCFFCRGYAARRDASRDYRRRKKKS